MKTQSIAKRLVTPLLAMAFTLGLAGGAWGDLFWNGSAEATWGTGFGTGDGNYVLNSANDVTVNFDTSYSIASGVWVESGSYTVTFKGASTEVGLEMTGSATNMWGGGFHVGGWGGNGNLIIDGGSYTIPNALFVPVERKGDKDDPVSATFELKDGVVSAGALVLGREVTCEGTATLSGGILETSQVYVDGGSGTLMFGGGTLKASAGGTLIASGMTVTVGANGGTIDTNGKAVTIASAITGTGTLRIIGGGVVTFTVAPTCALNVENGVAVLPKNSATGAIEIGAHGVLAFDLTGETITSGSDYMLATGVTSLTVPSGESYADSIFTIGPDFTSEITLDGTTLKATATSDATYTGDTPNVRYITASSGGWIDDINVWANIERGPNGATNGNNGDHTADYDGDAYRRDIVVFPNNADVYFWEANHPDNFTIVNRASTLTLKSWTANIPTLVLAGLSNTGTIVDGTGDGGSLNGFNVTVNSTVTQGGTVTLSSGTLTFPAGSTFADISATSVKVTGDSVVTGSALFTLTAAAPTFALSSVTTRLGATHFTNTTGVYTAGKKYYWIGGDTASPATAVLSDTTKWAFADSTDSQYLTGEIPGPADTAVFATCAGSGAVLDANVSYNISIETDFTIYQETANTTYSIGTLADPNAGVQKTYFDIAQGKTALLYARSQTGAVYKQISLYSSLTGLGSLQTKNGNNNGCVNFYGDLSDFYGEANLINERNLYQAFKFFTGANKAPNSVWNIGVENSNQNSQPTFQGTDTVFHFGALRLNAYTRTSGGGSTDNMSVATRVLTFNIGGLGKSSCITGNWSSLWKPTINWTDSTATFTNAAVNTAALNITGGGYAYISSVPDKIGISDNGGWLVINSNNSSVASDIVNNIDANSTDAPLKFDVESAVSVDSVTSSAVLNNANGFTKTGLGSLTLTGNFTKIGEVNVTDGQLVVDSESALTQGTDYTLGGSTLCTVDGTTYTFGVGAASFNGQAYISIQAAVNAASEAGESVEKTVTLLRNAGEDVEIPAAGITIEYGEYDNIGSITGVLGIVVTWSGEQKTWVSSFDPAYIWRNTTLDNKWNTPANWETAGVAATVVPTASDVVIFPESASPWTVELTAMGYAKQLQVNSPVTFSGNRIAVFDDGASAITGTATITLDNNSGFYTGDTDGRSLTVDNPLDIIAAKDYPAKITAKTHNSVKSGYTLILNGNLTGNGYLTMGGTRTTHRFNGNNSGFSGSLSIPDTSSTSSGAQRSSVYFKNASAASGSAKWLIYQYLNGGNMIGNGGGTWAFGNLSGLINNSYAANYSKNGTWWEIGASNGDDELTFTGNNRSDIIRKKGTGTLTITAGSSVVSGYELYDGVVRLLGDSAMPRSPADGPGNYIKFHGGTLAFGHDVTFDPSQYFVADGNYPISFSNDTGCGSTWNTQISVSFTGGLTKKGAGTLTLSAVPKYTGTTKVEAGALYVIVDSENPFNPTLDPSTAEVTTDKDGYRKFVPASATVGDVSVEYGADFATANVTVALSGDGVDGKEYKLTVGGVTTTATAANGSVTFTGVSTGHSTAYDSFAYAVSSDTVSVTGDAASGSKTIADEADWFSTGADGSTEQTSGGSWDGTMTWTDGKTTFDEDGNTFTATAASSASTVDVAMQICFGNANDDASIDFTGAEAAVKIATENNALVFQALNDGAFVTLSGLTPDAESTYDVVLHFDYATHTYTVTIGETTLTYNGSAELAMSSESTGIQSVAFKGVGTLTSLVGTQAEGYVAMDAKGNRYATIEEAMAAAESDSSKLPLTVLHDGTYNGETYSKGVAVVPSDASGEIAISAESQDAADAVAAQMSIALTSAQKNQGLKAEYYKAVATASTSGTYAISFALADEVKPTVADEESTKAMETTTSSVALHVTNTKVGLYYGIAAGARTDLGIADAATLTKCVSDGEDLGLTADLPESGVMYYKVIVSDTAPASEP